MVVYYEEILKVVMYPTATPDMFETRHDYGLIGNIMEMRKILGKPHA
jgi:hypothetical protein